MAKAPLGCGAFVRSGANWLLPLPLVGVVLTRVQVLPDVIDFTFIPTCAGSAGLAAMAIGAALRFDPDRLGRITVFGQLVGGAAGSAGLVILLVAG